MAIVVDVRYRLEFGIAVPALVLTFCDFLQDVIQVLVETGVFREHRGGRICLILASLLVLGFGVEQIGCGIGSVRVHVPIGVNTCVRLDKTGTRLQGFDHNGVRNACDLVVDSAHRCGMAQRRLSPQLLRFS